MQVELTLSGLDRYKATIDISNYLIKIASNLLCTPLTNLFNESIESGIVPDVFKISKATPVFKTGATTNPGNYRPIAMEFEVFPSNVLKAILKAEHSLLKLKMLNQTHFLSNVVYHKTLLLAHFCF